MPDKKDTSQSQKEMPKAFDEHEKNMDGSEKDDAPYQQYRKIGPDLPKDKKIPLKQKE